MILYYCYTYCNLYFISVFCILLFFLCSVYHLAHHMHSTGIVHFLTVANGTLPESLTWLSQGLWWACTGARREAEKGQDGAGSGCNWVFKGAGEEARMVQEGAGLVAAALAESWLPSWAWFSIMCQHGLASNIAGADPSRPIGLAYLRQLFLCRNQYAKTFPYRIQGTLYWWHCSLPLQIGWCHWELWLWLSC